MQPQISEREKTDINSNSYSVKLLTTIASPDALVKRDFKKITNLQELSNRLKMANEGYKHKPNSIQNVKEWMNQEGIKFNTTINLIEKARKQQTLPKPKVAVTSWNNLEFQPMKTLSFEEFVQQNEERVAYASVMQSLSNRTHRKTNRHMKNIRANVLNKLKGISDNKRVDNSVSAITEQTTTRNTLASIVQQGLDIDKEQVLTELHNRLAKFFKGTYTHWIQLLASQIEMINFLQENGKQANLVSNFIYIASLKSLQSQYEKQFKNRRLKRQEFLQSCYEKAVTKDRKYWAQVFFYLRVGQIEKCVLLLKQNGHFELMEDLLNLEEQLNQFKVIEPSYQIEPNQKNTPFERVIKLVVKGEYQPLFRELTKEIQLLDQPWLILLTLLIKREKEVDRKRNHDATILNYFRSYAGKLQNSDSVFSLLVGLLSMGAYKLVIQLYEDLSITASSLEYDYFIHIFILFAGNPNLLLAMYPLSIHHKTTQNILNVCLTQIVLYLKVLLKYHSPHYNNYFRLVLQIIENLGQKMAQFSLKPCIKTICQELFPNVSSLSLLNSSKLSNLNVENMTNDIFFNQLLLNMTYRVDSEYFELADFCMSYNRPDIQQHILLSFVIKTEMQEQLRERETIRTGIFQVVQNSDQKARDVETALNTLQTMHTNDEMVWFLRELREVKRLLRERRKVEITGRIKRTEKFRNDQAILNYLEKMQRRDGHSYFDVYVSYYDRLYQAYQIVYIALNKISTLKELSQNMIQELQDLRISFSGMNSDLYGRTVAILRK